MRQLVFGYTRERILGGFAEEVQGMKVLGWKDGVEMIPQIMTMQPVVGRVL